MSTLIAAGTLRPTRTQTHRLQVGSAGLVEVTVQDRDRTRPFLLLHGGGGVMTMAGFADLRAERTHSRVLLPTHPGFGGTPKPGWVGSVTRLAQAYVTMLEQFDLTDVTVIGNSFGGWLAAEIALRHSPRVSGVVIIDGIGIEVPGHPITDVSSLSPAEIRSYSFHDPSKAPVPPDTGGTGPSPDVQALISYTGPAMSDPALERSAQAQTARSSHTAQTAQAAQPATGTAAPPKRRADLLGQPGPMVDRECLLVLAASGPCGPSAHGAGGGRPAAQSAADIGSEPDAWSTSGPHIWGPRGRAMTD